MLLGDHGCTIMTSSWQEEQILALSCIVAAELCGSPSWPDLPLVAYRRLALDLWWFEDRSFNGVSGMSSQILQFALP